MANSSGILIPANVAFGHRSETSVELILGAIPLLGPLLQALLDPTAYLFGAFVGSLSGAQISTAILKALPNNTLKNVYVAGTVGFFLIVNLLGRIPFLLPIAVLIGAINAVIDGLLGGIFGFLADLLGGGRT